MSSIKEMKKEIASIQSDMAPMEARVKNLQRTVRDAERYENNRRMSTLLTLLRVQTTGALLLDVLAPTHIGNGCSDGIPSIISTYCPRCVMTRAMGTGAFEPTYSFSMVFDELLEVD